jgi:hypothetical protein
MESDIPHAVALFTGCHEMISSQEGRSFRDGIWVPCCESVRRAVYFTLLMLQMYSMEMACKPAITALAVYC